MPYAKPIRYGITSEWLTHRERAACRRSTYRLQDLEPILSIRRKPNGRRMGSRRPACVRRVGITNMVNCTKVYAMAALDICNKNKEEVAKTLRSPTT